MTPNQIPCTATDSQNTAAAGRPRDPEIDAKLLQATLDVYGELGWNGLTLTKIATTAKVGKSALYSRWNTKATILADAFDTIKILPPTGKTLQEILRNEAEFRLHLYLGRNSTAVRRLLFEAATIHEPKILQLHQKIFTTPAHDLANALWKFKETGELPESVSATRLIDAIIGSVLSRTFAISAAQYSCFTSEPEPYLEALIDDQIAHLLPRS